MLDQDTLSKLKSKPRSMISGPSAGSGCYGAVFPGPIPGTVIKRGNSCRDVWLVWAAICMTTTPRPRWMPNIMAVHVDEAEDSYYAIMEKLDEQPEPFHLKVGISKSCRIHYYLSSRCCDHLYSDHAIGKFPRDVFERFRWTIQRHSEHLDREGMWIDTHDGNFMVRGDQLVITDPFAGTPSWTPQGVRKILAEADTKPLFTFNEMI